MKFPVLILSLLLSTPSLGEQSNCDNGNRASKAAAYHPPPGAVATEESMVYSAPVAGCETKSVVLVGQSLVVYSEAGEWFQVMSFAEDSYPEIDGWVLKRNTRETGTMGATYD